MRREHIEPNGYWWVLPGQRIPALGWNGTKNGDDNHIWLPQPLRELIGDGATGFVFTNGNGGPVSKVDKLMRRICKEIEIERATPHDLRRTHQTLLARCGASLDLVDRIGNHRMKKIRRTYVHYDYRPEIQRAMEVTAAFIMDLVEGRRPDNVIPLVR
jgi:integrase